MIRRWLAALAARAHQCCNLNGDNCYCPPDCDCQCPGCNCS